MARVVIIDAHPDPDPARFCHALASSYVEGARDGGHDAVIVRLSDMEFPLLREREDWEKGTPPASIKAAQEAISAAQHIVFVFPLWLGDMPALLKAFLEQTLRPEFAFSYGDGKSLPRKLLGGRSARIVVTMGMPALAYRWYYRAHSVRSLKRNILAFVGISPVATTLIGSIEGIGDSGRRRWLEDMKQLGRRAA